MSLYDEYSGGVKSSQTLLEYLYFNGVMVREGVHYFEPDQIQEILQRLEKQK